MHILKWLLKAAAAGIAAIAILCGLLCFYDIVPVHEENKKGNTDYVWPAKLIFSNFNFKKNKITSSSNIKSITVSFEDRMVAIDTGTGKKYDNFGPTFHANKKDWTTKIYFQKGNSVLSNAPLIGQKRRARLEPPDRLGLGHNFELQLLPFGQSVFLADHSV